MKLSANIHKWICQLMVIWFWQNRLNIFMPLRNYDFFCKNHNWCFLKKMNDRRPRHMSHSDELPSTNALSALQHHLSGTLSMSPFRTVTRLHYLNLDLKHICSPPSMLLNSPVRQRLWSHGNMALYKFCVVLYCIVLYLIQFHRKTRHLGARRIIKLFPEKKWTLSWMRLITRSGGSCRTGFMVARLPVLTELKQHILTNGQDWSATDWQCHKTVA